MRLRQSSRNRQRLAAALCGSALLALAGWGCNSSRIRIRSGTRQEEDRPQTRRSTRRTRSSSASAPRRTASARVGSLARVKGTHRGQEQRRRLRSLRPPRRAASWPSVRLGHGRRRRRPPSPSCARIRQVLYAEPQLHRPRHRRRPTIRASPSCTAWTTPARPAAPRTPTSTRPRRGTSASAARDVVVGVVDTGIDYNHEDLAANMWVNPDEIAGQRRRRRRQRLHRRRARLQRHHRQRRSDRRPRPRHALLRHHRRGRQQRRRRGRRELGRPDHGPQVPRRRAAAARSRTPSRPSTTRSRMKNAGVNLRVLSNSWGGGGFSQALLDAITAASDADILFVAAAGNAALRQRRRSRPTRPTTTRPNVVSVAATDHNDALAFFSNFGATTVDLGAPGVDVLSTTPGNTYSAVQRHLDGHPARGRRRRPGAVGQRHAHRRRAQGRCS